MYDVPTYTQQPRILKVGLGLGDAVSVAGLKWRHNDQ